jgi:small subunit ribosomal protein S19
MYKGPFFEGITRRSTIMPHCIDRTYDIHNGKQYVKVSVTYDMVGYKFGAFVKTKKKVVHINRKSKR